MKNGKSRLIWGSIAGVAIVPVVGLIYSIARNNFSMLWISFLLILIPVTFVILGAGIGLITARFKKSNRNTK